ncbi:nudix domain-containing protein [Colletotrichum sojae]|uniref:Nudix domain-containing protein n=1 Tax=Colletotrichum sojae TaxID=2175907 RepID=A0A8H6JII2_9PEZI|nr:nudix domain-containing protein [Colletotrichum sojae]
MAAACEAKPQRNTGRLPPEPNLTFHALPTTSSYPAARVFVDPQNCKIAILRGRRRRHPLPLLIATGATPSQQIAGTFPLGESPDVTDGLVNCEPSSVCVYPRIFTVALKMVFWFGSRMSESQAPDEVEQVPWDANVRLEWVKAKETAGLMTFRADGQVTEKVLEDMSNSGHDI